MHIKLPVDVLKQGKRYVVYSPALDLSTSGKTLREAQKHFYEAVDLFLEELIENDTFEDVLKDLGWKKIKTKWQPPQMVMQKPFNIQLPVAA